MSWGNPSMHAPDTGPGLPNRRIAALIAGRDDPLHGALREAATPLLLFDETGLVLLRSRGWSDLAGNAGADPCTVEEWAADTFRSEDGASVLRCLREALGPEPGATTTEFTSESGSGTARLWSLAVSPLGTLDGERRLFLCVATDVTSRSRAKESERQMLAELDHRIRNRLAAVQSIACRTLGSSEVGEALAGRIDAIARTHTLLTRNSWGTTSLAALISAIAEPHDDRIALDGPDVRLDSRATQSFGMALHELVTNAVRFGALSHPGGHIVIRWRVTPGPRDQLVIDWQEHGGPPVTPPTRRGWGARIIEQCLSYDLGGAARLDFRPDGLRAALELPVSEAPSTG